MDDEAVDEGERRRELRVEDEIRRNRGAFDDGG
jgi:hypothetical protein